jgi:hypothetical protein
VRSGADFGQHLAVRLVLLSGQAKTAALKRNKTVNRKRFAFISADELVPSGNQ